MEPKQNEVESIITPLKKVTRLSKYLAMVLFIILPFLGGYAGYMLALEKVVEIENTASRQVITEEMGDTLREDMLPKSAEVTSVSNVSVSFQKVADWITYSSTEEQRVQGVATLYNQNLGPIVLGAMTVYTHESGLDPTRVEIKKIDNTIDNLVTQLTKDQMFSTTTSENIQIAGEYGQNETVKITQSVTTNDCKWITYLHEINQSTGIVEITTCPTHPKGYDATKIMVAESVKFLLSQ